jgi:hypothetical protein
MTAEFLETNYSTRAAIGSGNIQRVKRAPKLFYTSGRFSKHTFIFAKLCYPLRLMNRAVAFSFLIFTFAAPLFVRAANNNPTPPPATSNVASALVFDSEVKEYAAHPGEAMAPFVFNLTNVSSAEVVINNVTTSCGCTVAQLPAQPWHIAPGTNGQIKVTVNLAGKPPGRTTKQVTINSSVGTKALLVNVDIPPATPPPTENLRGDRNANMEKAKADRQIVFQGDCRSCHVDKGADKIGKELYAADCGICHDSNHRASSVPDLRAPKAPRDHLYWSSWIAHGRPGSLMPAFATTDGGPLSEKQIDSLVAYLSKEFPQGPTVPVIPTTIKVPSAVTGANQ